MKRMRIFLTAVVFSTLACASSTGGGSRGSGDLVTHEQLAATNSTDVYGAIEKLRPEWLTSRGPTSVTDASPTQPSVFINGQLMGTVEYLRQVRVLEIASIRFWTAGPASARFGMGHQRGVLELIRQ